MKVYEAPEIQVSAFAVEDIVTVSIVEGTGGDGNTGGEIF